MPSRAFLRFTAATILVTVTAAFAPAGGDTSPPDLCGLAARLNDAALADVCGQVRYLGHGTFTELNVIPAPLNVLGAVKQGADGRDELAAKRQFFEFDEFVLTVLDDSETRLDMVLRTAATLARLEVQHPDAYRFMTATKTFPTAPPMETTSWMNRFDRIIISFDRTPDAIAAGATVLSPGVNQNGMTGHTNFALVSIDEETILGATPGKGSHTIYGLPTAAENYHAYMRDGLLYSLVHEMTHRYIDYTNSTSRLSNALHFNRNAVGTDAEEVVANETAMSFVRSVMSPEMHRHVMEQNRRLVANAAVRRRLGELNRMTGMGHSPLVVPD